MNWNILVLFACSAQSVARAQDIWQFESKPMSMSRPPSLQKMFINEVINRNWGCSHFTVRREHEARSLLGFMNPQVRNSSTGPANKAFTRLGEMSFCSCLSVLLGIASVLLSKTSRAPLKGRSQIYSCCCLPLLLQLACSILATWEQPYSQALYKPLFSPGYMDFSKLY